MPVSKPTVLHETPEVRNCLAEALSAGFWSGLKASVLSGGLYYLAWNHSDFFRRSFSAGGRTALTVMPIFYAAWLNVEQTMHACVKDLAPEYVVKDDD